MTHLHISVPAITRGTLARTHELKMKLTCARFARDMPNTAAKALKECDDDLFPNIYTLLKICATIPATSCECERSATSLRRLHTYNRACMGQERLSSLALMHIHYQVKIVLDEVVNLFATKHPRRLELGTILSIQTIENTFW